MLQIGTAQAPPGTRAFGIIEVDYTLSRMPITIPVNIINGTRDGPTLAIGAAVHGPEIIGSLGLGKLLRELDPAAVSGQLIVIPVVNTSAFEFGQRETRWDGQDLNRQGRGRADGSISERLAYAYFENVIRPADYFIDIHSGGPETYFYYTIFLSDAPGVEFEPGVVESSRQMAFAFGLEHIFAKTPWRGTFKEEAMKEGVPAIAIEMAGGPDFFHNADAQIETCYRGVTNVMKYLGMLEGEIVVEARQCKLWEAHTEIVAGAEAGFMLRQARWGDYLAAGDTYAIVYHPYTGEELGRITAPNAGTVLNSGTIWPPISAGRWLAVLGDLIEEVPLGYKVVGDTENYVD
jgi:predicted deacylase